MLLGTEGGKDNMALKVISNCFCGFMTVIAFTACGGNDIEGEWIGPVPGMENMVQGINLEKGGKASSINMATLQYESWEVKDNELILSGKSIGNKETFSFSDTLIIEKLTENELTLKKGSLTINYNKR